MEEIVANTLTHTNILTCTCTNTDRPPDVANCE